MSQNCASRPTPHIILEDSNGVGIPQTRYGTREGFLPKWNIDEPHALYELSSPEKIYLLDTAHLSGSYGEGVVGCIRKIRNSFVFAVAARTRRYRCGTMSDADQSFAPDTRGFLYYLPKKKRRNTRFGLDDNVTEFSRGTDLPKQDGRKSTLAGWHDHEDGSISPALGHDRGKASILHCGY